MLNLLRPKPDLATRDIERSRDFLMRNVQTKLDPILQAKASPEEIEQAFAYSQEALGAVRQLQKYLGNGSRKDVKPNRRHYVIGSLFVYELYDYCTTDPNGHERVVIVSGVHTPTGDIVLDTLHKVPMSEQTAVFVKADEAKKNQLIDQLHTHFKHDLLGMFHNHPCIGRDGTTPSAVDLKHQATMVSFGLPHMLGGIFSRDGWFRIFNTEADFDLTVYGDGVTLVENEPREKIIKIDIKEKPHALFP